MSKYHFIAIGGIGMSGLAKYLLEDGHTVTGSDIADSKYIAKLKDLGAVVHIGHSEDNLPDDTDVVIKSSAIRDNNPELIKAKRLGIPIYHRSDLLEEIAKSAQDNGKCFIGFSGTHGKTTTSGLASFVLEKADLEPSFVVGGIIPEIHTNAQHRGKCIEQSLNLQTEHPEETGKYFIAELDESDGTIVKYYPDILVINNLEEDHIDFYKNGMSDLIKTFNKAISQAKKVLINNDNEGTRKLSGNFITFGLKDADYTAQKVDNETIEIFYHNKLLTSVKIQLAGVHNIYNTLAVIAALNEAGVNIGNISKYFYSFTGMGRRFQKVCEVCGIQVYDDYAHHPTEIKATLEAAASKFGKENIVAVFQPHRYTRLQSLWNEFKGAFSNAGRVIVTDVYAASEDPIEGINGEAFAEDLEGSEYLSGNMEQVAEKLLPTLKKGNIVIGLGAGTITNLGKNLEKAGCVAN